ncbi:hypothetical protein HY338_04080 [Candidatus Gottesmanbacteria bacterium]|nr:hypothetical protein [Candidatus Gottesmanbacteria bacterium]
MPVRDNKRHPDKNRLFKMASQTLLFIILVFLIFLIARKNHNLLYLLLFLWTNSRNFAINFLSAIFLLGTLIHEVSHWITATLLRVPTGELSILPKIKDNGEIQAGKLEIAKTDPFRHALIGLAPMLIGLVLIYLIGRIFFINLSDIFNTKNLILNTIGGYLLFVITSTMFSSRKDLETMVIALPVMLLVIFMLNYIGVRIFFDPTLFEKTQKILAELNGYLLICSVVDLFVLIFFQTNISLWQKILKKNIITVKKH